MAINAYVGLFGHGKTYTIVANVILPALKKGRKVFTNIPVYDDLLIRDFGHSVIPFTVDEIKHNDKWWTEVFEYGAVFVIDEAWRIWPAGTKINDVRDSDKEFFNEHRHMVSEDGISTDICICCVDLAVMASFIKAMIETTFRTKKMVSLGLTKHYRVDVFERAVTGANPPLSRRVTYYQGKYREEVYKYYKSQTKSKSNEHGLEIGSDDRTNVLKNKAILLKALITLLMLIGSGAYLLSFFDRDKQENEEQVLYEHEVEPSDIQNFVSNENNVRFNNGVVKNIDFLSSADEFYINSNRGIFPHVDYVLRVEFDGTYTDLRERDLVRLGYQVMGINSCLVRIRGRGNDKYAGCIEGFDDRRQEQIETF